MPLPRRGQTEALIGTRRLRCDLPSFGEVLRCFVKAPLVQEKISKLVEDLNWREHSCRNPFFRREGRRDIVTNGLESRREQIPLQFNCHGFEISVKGVDEGGFDWN